MQFRLSSFLLCALAAVNTINAAAIAKRDLTVADVSVYAVIGSGATISGNQCTVGQGLVTATLQLSALNFVNVCACADVLRFDDPTVTPCQPCGRLGSAVCASGCDCDCTENAIKTDGRCADCAEGFHLSASGTRCEADPVCPDQSSAVCSSGDCICVCNTGFIEVPGSDPLRCVLQASGANIRAKRMQKTPRAECSIGTMSCPAPTGGFECVDATSLDNCGKCGNNCEDMPGVARVGCEQDGCHVFSCRSGFKLRAGKCLPIF